MSEQAFAVSRDRIRFRYVPLWLLCGLPMIGAPQSARALPMTATMQPAPTKVPEPASWISLALGSFALTLVGRGKRSPRRIRDHRVPPAL